MLHFRFSFKFLHIGPELISYLIQPPRDNGDSPRFPAPHTHARGAGITIQCCAHVCVCEYAHKRDYSDGLGWGE